MIIGRWGQKIVEGKIITHNFIVCKVTIMHVLGFHMSFYIFYLPLFDIPI